MYPPVFRRVYFSGRTHPSRIQNPNAGTLALGRTGSGTKLALGLAKDRPCSDSRLMGTCIQSEC